MSILVLNWAFWIEITALLKPQWFLLIASLANVGKNVCFMLSSVSRASINLSFAKANNIADIQGKSVSQFTASTLFGGGIGLALSRFIDITSLTHLVPTFLVLTGIQAVTTHISTKIVDEPYLHGQRANLLFNDYFERGSKQFESCKQINDQEIFYLPNFVNHQVENYIQYGKNSIGSILASPNKHYRESMIHQLHKMEAYNR